jgi:hypothetical protein
MLGYLSRGLEFISLGNYNCYMNTYLKSYQKKLNK